MAADNLIPLNLSNSLSNLGSESDSEELVGLRFPVWATILMTFAYTIVFIFGVLGNCSVIVVVIKHPRLQNITNLFVCNLAIADFLVLVFCLVPNLISNIFIEWILGSYFCKTVPYIQGVSVCASVHSLVAISIERLYTTRRPFAPRMTTQQTIFIMILIWIWSCVVALPWALFFQTGPLHPDYPGLIFCVEIWPEAWNDWKAYYFLFGNFLICYVLPLSIILFSYVLICWTVYSRRRRGGSLPSTNNTNRVLPIHRQNEALVMVKTLLVIVLIFFLTWLPLYYINLRLKFYSEGMSELESSIIETSYPIAQLLGHVGSAVNPFVYGFRKKEFMNGLADIIRTKPESPPEDGREQNMRMELRMIRGTL